MRKRLLSVLLVVACLSAPAIARAEFFYVTPVLGLEWINQGSASLGSGGVATASARGVGIAFGGHAGFALGPLRLGALFQHTALFETPLHFNKLYGEIGLAPRFGFLGLWFSLAGGWAFYGSEALGLAHGAGGRATAAIDFYIGDHFSIGPGLSFDVAGYFPSSNSAVVTYGLTGVLRVGIHL